LKCSLYQNCSRELENVLCNCWTITTLTLYVNVLSVNEYRLHSSVSQVNCLVLITSTTRVITFVQTHVPTS